MEVQEEALNIDIRRIGLDERGILSAPFGPGFLDEANNLAIDLFKLTQEQQN